MYSETITAIAFFASVAFCFYFFLKTRHSERMALIEKNLFNVEFKTNNFSFFKFLFKVGFLVIGIGIGLLVATIIHSLTILDDDPLYFSLLFIFGGLGLLASYIFDKKKLRGEE